MKVTKIAEQNNQQILKNTWINSRTYLGRTIFSLRQEQMSHTEVEDNGPVHQFIC